MENTILGFDIKDYSLSENESDMIQKREQLFDILRQSASNYPKILESLDNYSTTLDQGDGCFVIVDSGDYAGVVDFFNTVYENSLRHSLFRFRGMIHRGIINKQQNINKTGFTWIGDGLNETARFLNSSELKSLLTLNTDVNFVYGISKEFFNQASAELFFKKEDYKSYTFSVKQFTGEIYLYSKGIQNFPTEKKQLNTLEISSVFKTYLEQAEFKYPDKPNNLDSFFIYPNLIHEVTDEKQGHKIDADLFISKYCEAPTNVLICGDEQYEKTALAKKVFERIFDTGELIPLFVECKIKERKLLKNLINDVLKYEYGIKENELLEEQKKYVLIFDDFNNWEQVQQEKILKDISLMNTAYTILFSDKLFFEDIQKRNLIKSFEIYSLSAFGHKKRYELIEKWISFTGEENDNYQSTDELNAFVDKTLINGLLPYTPFFILTILLAKRDFASNPNLEITSKAHCYQALVYINLRTMGIKDTQINTYLNIFSYIAYYLFDNKRRNLSEDELISVMERYEQEYNLPFEIDDLLKKFQMTSIFSKNDMNQYSFVSTYAYYYFVGKYLAEHIKDTKIFSQIEDIYDNLHITENSFIAIFIVHHTKDIAFYDQVSINTQKLFTDNKESVLDEGELKFVDNAFKEIEKLIINKYDNSRQIRLNDAEKQDEIEAEQNDDVAENITKSISDIKKSLRTTEVLGQIIKNHGELPKQKVIDYFTVGMNTYRRICDYFLTFFRDLKGSFLEFIQDRLLEEETLSNGDVSKISYRIYASFNFAIIYSTIYRITESFGSKDLIKIIRTIYEEEKNPLTYCVYLQCILWYKKEVPFDELKEKYKEFPDTIKYLIRYMLKEFTDRHRISIKTKLEIASALDMDIKALDYDATR
ncbi:MAG: hypothetical protein IJ191_07875 [Treponema sp.]|nr:hypothetical protein [Treponema sp.]